MKVLVTGGAGFIGSHLVERLANANQVVVLDDFSAGMKENLAHLKNMGIEIVKGSVANSEIVEYCVRDADQIFHLAGKTNVDESLYFPEIFNEVNANGTLNILRSAKQRNIPIVHMSTSEVYGSAQYAPMNEMHPLNPQSPYAASKVAAERYCYSFFTSFKSKVVIIRSFNNYGPRQKGNVEFGGLIASNIIRILRNQAPIIRGNGNQTRDYMFVKDTVEALLKIGGESSLYGEVLNLGTGIDYSASKIVQMILEITRSDLEPLAEASRPGDVDRLVCDASKAFRKTNWKPKYDLKKGLEETIEWYRNNINRFDDYIFPSFRQKW